MRARYRGGFRDLLTASPRIERGFAYTMDGLDTALHPELRSRTDVAIRRSAA